MSPDNNEIESIVSEVTAILRNRLNSLVTKVKNDENNEAVLNLPIVRQVLTSIGRQSDAGYGQTTNNILNQLQTDNAVTKNNIETLFNMCSMINSSITNLQTSIDKLVNEQALAQELALAQVEEKEEQNIKMVVVEKQKKPTYNLIEVEEEEEQLDSLEVEQSDSVEVEPSDSNESLEEEVEEEVEEEHSDSNESLEEEEVASETEEVEETVEEVASETVEEEVASETVEQSDSNEEEEEGGDLEVFEIEIDDVTYFATDEENGDLYEVDKDGDIGKKVGFIKDGEVEFI